MLDLTDDEWFTRLNARRINQLTKSLEHWAYYDNEQPLRYVAKILQEQSDRFPPLRVNWSALPLDALGERVEWQGWRISGQDSPDDDLTAVWDENDLAALQVENTTASMVAEQAYWMVGPPIDDVPVVTTEYGDQVAVEIDPVTGQTVAAVKVWASDTEAKVYDMATLYLPGRVITYEQGEKVEESAAPGWTKGTEDEQGSSLVPVVPVFNRRRRWRGYSELRDLIPLVDAVNQTATNMLAGMEHHALPRRWAIGLSKDDFTDAEGKPLNAWQIAAGAFWGIPRAEDDTGLLGEEAQPKVGQFSAADMQNFHGTLRTLGLIASSLAALDPRLFGVATDNPVSADAIRASENRLIKRAERQALVRTRPCRQVGRLALASVGRDPKTKVEPIWRNPATPTLAAQADYAQKLLSEGVIDVEQAQEDCGYSLAQRAAMAARRRSDVGQADRIVAGIRGLQLPAAAGTQPTAA